MSISGPISPGSSALGQLDLRAFSGQDAADASHSGRRAAPGEAQAPPALRDRVEAEPVAAQADPGSIFAALAASNTPAQDADGARLLALSVRQGLQEQTASIANLRPNSILQYLRA